MDTIKILIELCLDAITSIIVNLLLLALKDLNLKISLTKQLIKISLLPKLELQFLILICINLFILLEKELKLFMLFGIIFLCLKINFIFIALKNFLDSN